MPENQDDSDMFEVEEIKEAPTQKPMPKPVPVKAVEEMTTVEENEEIDGDDDESYVPIVEPFTTKNGYVFSLTLIQDEDMDRFVQVQLDNTTVELPLQDWLEATGAFSSAIPTLIAEAKKE